MSIIHTDRLVNDVLGSIGQTLNNGTTYTSFPIDLDGAQAVSIQVLCSNNCAGTLYVDGTNQTVASQYNQAPANPAAVFLNASSTTLTANQQSVITFTLTDEITSMHTMRIRFVPSANGNCQISVNVRRMSN